MVNRNFDKPIIASYTEIAALLCVVRNISPATTLWKYQLYSNLCWEHKSHVLYICGKYDHFSYREFEDERRILLHKLPKQTLCSEIKEYIDKGFFALVPINTKLLGITDHPFKHNVFLAGYENDGFVVYDFWPPSFTWKCKKIDGKALFQSIDFTNSDTVQSFYVFKENKISSVDDSLHIDIKELHSLFFAHREVTKNEQYDTERSAYGFSAYSSLCDYLASLRALSLTDCQNFHVLYDHLNFTQHCLRVLFGEFPPIQSVLLVYANLISCANRLRMLAYKHYISKKDIGNLQALMVDQVRTIGETEQTVINHLIDDGERVNFDFEELHHRARP